MRFTFYCDTWPGSPLASHGLFATTQPSAKMTGCRRYMFTVDLPGFEGDAAPVIEQPVEVDVDAPTTTQEVS